MSSSSSASSYSINSSSYHISSKSSSSSISSLASESPITSSSSSKTDAFFASPFSSISTGPLISTETPKIIRIPSLSRLFPSRYNSERSLTLPTPIGSPRLHASDAGTPTRSSTMNGSESSTELTPKPQSHIPAFLGPSASLFQDCLTPGSVISSPTDGGISIKLIRTLGQGAFSNVWLGEDISGEPLTPLVRSLSQKKRRHHNVSDDGAIRGTKPCRTVLRERRVGGDSIYLDERDGEAGHSRSHGVKVPRDVAHGRLVAVKMTPRVDEERHAGDRTRVSFIREVEVLKHISHPYITLILGSFTTPSHHALVLPYLPGSDLLALVNSDEQHAQFTESMLRIIWRQLCSAVGWMHGVGLVHRDIKLENILLTQQFPFPAPSSPLTPLIKLTDFGLSRFIDLSSPLLATRCGSEAYAAPELVIGGGKYDGRETDAWACGVVLYGLMVRRLPFDDDYSPSGEVGIGREGEVGRQTRRSWLMKIAKGEWSWPASSVGASELRGSNLVESIGARSVAERLLVRTPKKRARVEDLWADAPNGEAWMGIKYPKDDDVNIIVPSTSSVDSADSKTGYVSSPLASSFGKETLESPSREYEDDPEGEEDFPDDRGCLVDREGIDMIACREVV